MLKKRTAVLLVIASLITGSLITFLISGPSFAGQASIGEGVFASITGGGLKQSEARKLGTAVDLIESNYYDEVDREKLLDGAINGMMESLGDPYSTYMAQETAQQFEESIEGSFSGIGAEVSSSEDGNVVVVSPIKGSPAEKAGIRAKDILVSVNDEPLQGLELNKAVAKIRGPKGSEAVIKVKREGAENTIEFVIVRDDVALETVNARMEEDGIGIIEITQFSLNTGDRFEEELKKLEDQGMKGLVIDVRNNPGGVLNVVIDIAELFVPKGELIVQVEDKNGNRDKSTSKGTSKDYPVTLLMNKGSASASEILAGALQQSAGAVLIGENSFGKGTVQTSFEKQLGDGSLLKITIAKWLTPDGSWIHETGIKPDIEVLPPEYFSVAPINKENTLKYNMNTTDVKNAQIMLNGLEFKTSRIDGYFDESTVKAVKSFQASKDMKQTGTIDADTAKAIEAALIDRIQDPKYDTQLKQGIEEIRKEIKASVSK